MIMHIHTNNVACILCIRTVYHHAYTIIVIVHRAQARHAIIGHDIHMLLCPRACTMYRGRITYDYFIVFNEMDHVYMRGRIIIADSGRAEITFPEHCMYP